MWHAIKWVYDAPGIIRQVQLHLGWPTPNHLMTHYFRRYPHTSWWARAHQYTLTGARRYNIVYLLKCLARIAARARERMLEILEEEAKPGENPGASWEDRLRLRLGRLMRANGQDAPGNRQGKLVRHF